MSADVAVRLEAGCGMSGDITVYAATGFAGETLYVGQTNMLHRRVGEHRRSAPWWHRVAGIQAIREGMSRLDALALERHLIQACRPKFNIAHGDSQVAVLEIALERLLNDHGDTAEAMASVAGVVNTADLLGIVAASRNRRKAEELVCATADRLLALCSKHGVDTVAEALNLEGGRSE